MPVQQNGSHRRFADSSATTDPSTHMNSPWAHTLLHRALASRIVGRLNPAASLQRGCPVGPWSSLTALIVSLRGPCILAQTRRVPRILLQPTHGLSSDAVNLPRVPWLPVAKGELSQSAEFSQPSLLWRASQLSQKEEGGEPAVGWGCRKREAKPVTKSSRRAWNPKRTAHSNAQPQRRWLMIQGKRIQALVRTSVSAVIAVALAACSASTYPAPTTQTPDPPTRQSDAPDSRPMLPEVLVTAPRLNSARVAEETSSQPPAKRRGG